MNERFKDQRKTCIECGTSFIWTADDQAYNAEHGYRSPRRCCRCRREQRARFRDRDDAPR